MIVNTYHLMAGNCGKVINRLLEFSPRMIWAHPNILCVLANYIIEKGRGPIAVPLVITYGEKIYPHIRRILREAFRAEFFEYYGNRENSVAAWGRSDGCFFEVSEYCHLEPDSRNDKNESENPSDLLTTSLHNYAVPLIRYDSEDLVRWFGYAHNDDLYPCFELLGGRGKDILLSRDGLVVPYTPQCFDHMHTAWIKKYQLEQRSLDEVIIRMVPLRDYDRRTDEPVLLKAYDEMLLGRFKLAIEYVDDIPLTAGGKYPVVVSVLATQYLETGPARGVGSPPKSISK